MKDLAKVCFSLLWIGESLDPTVGARGAELGTFCASFNYGPRSVQSGEPFFTIGRISFEWLEPALEVGKACSLKTWCSAHR
jgi:hypothetical protein